MPRSSDQSGHTAGESDAGARAILRVPEALIEIAAKRRGSSLAELTAQLSIPKASLHRLLRTLERGGYLTHEAGTYRLGPNSFHLASLIGQAAPARPFPACARPELEWLAAETGETVMLAVLTGQQDEIVYVDVIDSQEALRFTVPVGDRRPLFSAASGKAVLAWLPPAAQHDYIDKADFTPFTPYTTGRDELPGVLREIRASGVAFDVSGRAVGASAVASPVFDASGHAFCAISVAGPSDRIAANRARIEPLVRKSGERISRVLGFDETYPLA